MGSTVKKLQNKNFYIQNEFFQYWNAGWPYNEVKSDKVEEPHYNSTLYLDMFDPLFGLNKEQITLLQAPENVIAVNSGPGTGKSSMIPTLVAYWIKQKKFKAEEILILSFSEGELDILKEKLDSMTGKVGAAVTLTNFKSLCFDILTRQAKGMPRLYSPMERSRFLTLVFPFLTATEVETLSIEIESYEDKAKIPTEKEELIESYIASLERIGAYDSSLIYLQAYRLFIKDPGALIHFKEKYKAILIDDFQNIKSEEYDPLSLMLNTDFMYEEGAMKERKTLVFADLYQATCPHPGKTNPIYYRFLNEYAQREIHLKKNYRMQKNITGAAKKIISKLNKKAVFPLAAGTQKGEYIKVFCGSNEQEELNFIKNTLLTKIDEESLSPGDIGILYSHQETADKIAEILIKENIPVSYYPQTSFSLLPPFSSLLSLFNFMINQKDISSLTDILLNILKDFSPEDTRSIFLAGNRKEESLIMLVNRLYQAHQMTDSQYNQVTELLKFVKDLKRCIKEEGVSRGLEKVFLFYPNLQPEKPGLQLMQYHLMERAYLYENDFIGFLKSFYLYDFSDRPYYHPELAGLEPEEEEAENPEEEELLSKREGIRLLPYHSCKGKEFKTLFITGMEENALSANKAGRNLEMEYRLFYLALTRAKEAVYISYCTKREGVPTRKSPFLKEIKSYIQEINRPKENEAFTQMELFPV